MNALASIEQGLRDLGYEAGALHRAYSFADVLDPAAETRTVALAAFTQTPESFRSAAFGVVEDAPNSAAAVMANRALGAPIFFSIDGDDVGVWAVGARTAPRLLERLPVNQLPALFARRRDSWTPQALHRAKALGFPRGPVQFDFIDLGLLPAIEQEVQHKLHRTMAEVLDLLLPSQSGRDREKAAFRLTFRLLAAKILIDREHPAAAGWAHEDVAAVLNGIQGYYGLGLLGTDVAAVATDDIVVAWARLRQSISLRNISSDSLAFVYENTLVTADTRKLFGTHSTPRPVAEYMLSRIDLSRCDPAKVRIAEPFAGAGIFLVAALRELRDLLPPEWPAAERHQFLVERMAGAELDAFACEVATLSLILADYPNANGWHLSSTDLFKAGALEAFLKDTTLILCNPPFEDFTAEERADYPEAFAISPSKAMVALHAAIDAGPEALGFVLPRGVLQQTKYRKLRQRLAAAYGRVELVSLPDRIFEKATYPCALVIATERRAIENAEKPLRLTARTVVDSARVQFLADGSVSSVRETVRTAPEGNLWVSELEALWSYLQDAPRLGEQAEIFRGLQWRSQRAGVFDEAGPMRERGIYKPGDSLAPFHLMKPVWLSSDPELNLYPGPLARPWEKPKVIINNQRSSRGPWRLAAAADASGLWVSQQFTGIWPTRELGIDALAAILNGPLANAYVTEHSTDHDFTNVMLASMPLPRKLDAAALGEAVREYQAVLHEKLQTVLPVDYDARLNRLLVWIDALVLDGYDLPPRLERQLFDYFAGRDRPVLHEFRGWLPGDLKGYVPLFEWLTKGHGPNRGAWVLDVFKPAPAEENDALSRFLA
ncbi:DNA methyltransferase [Hephaestia sp. GCM10023244]|uniref:DNA methyltransferase n=1 Tax=unclassified Hephaestia TaxID=2631281 RepID=UPI0020779649|nr:DNA methyltransferase [Hephaestia sp. MAHUQ-44]MCM8732543.1 SAM-dependent DNA methyltransferase [Hephaestia sp. MAHUQ-44]